MSRVTLLMLTTLDFSLAAAAQLRHRKIAWRTSAHFLQYRPQKKHQQLAGCAKALVNYCSASNFDILVKQQFGVTDPDLVFQCWLLLVLQPWGNQLSRQQKSRIVYCFWRQQAETLATLQYQDKIYNQFMSLKICALVLLMAVAMAAPTQDEVLLSIPGYTAHKWYSGYLNITHGAFHYIFFESQYDPDNDPLVLWLNGGPGCSSLIGMVYENGPFVFEPNTTDFKINDYAWNKKANLLYISSPQGVGFSVGNAESLDDNTVAVYNLRALLNFFVKFPNMKKNDFYMTGESYAGIYIPYLANEILKHNKLPSSKESIIKLKGIMVGNACTDPRECYEPGDGLSIYQYKFLYDHAYLTDNEYNLMEANCILGYHSVGCQDVRRVLDKKFQATKSSILNIYAPCYFQKINATRKLRQSGRFSQVSIDEGACEDSMGIHSFFNQALTFQHFHVNKMKFTECSDEVANRYIMNANASIWIYPILMQANLRVWVYSGDVDADVPITGTLRWIERFKEDHGIPVVEPWREWWVKGLHTHEDQVGGMVWQLRNFTFASVKGAGHMVPHDKPKESFTLITSFLNGVPLPQKTQ